MRAVDIIIKKKNGASLTKEEIHYIINGYVNGNIPDYQISALLMAICFNGLDSEERYYLTKEMLESGEQIDLSKVNGICVDKHSTGGVGDKTTLVIAPILAACGLKLAKMSGRGLGHTGGTLDKLESIPGLTVDISSDDFFKQVNEIGLAVIGQTANITPADKKLYSLRDVTGTVDSVGLISGSIMSKKLASGASTILLDVKVGDGAFMKNIAEAKELANAMVDIGKKFNRSCIAMLTDMDQPLGEAVGNSLEVIEAIETLKGNGPTDFKKLCYEISSELLVSSQMFKCKDEAKKAIDDVISSGKALNKLKEMIIYQGGNPDVINDYSLFKTANNIVEVKSIKTGYIGKIKTENCGIAAMLLGAGRQTKEDIIDSSVGIKFIKKIGDFVNKDDIIAYVHTNGKNTESSIELIQNSYIITDKKVERKNIVLDIIRG